MASGSIPTGLLSPAFPKPPEHLAAAPNRRAQALLWSAAVGIGVSTLILIAVSAARHSWAVPSIPEPATGPPWVLPFSLSPELITLGLWAAGLLGGGGVIAGLAAVTRGAHFPVRLMVGGALIAVAALTVLPPAGSSDTLNYAAYGRMVVLGHTPYVLTPDQLRRLGDPVGLAAARTPWGKHVSLYGPLATGEEWAAATLGGTSVARIIFWLKLANALAFLAVALALEAMLRSDPARRARAHLLWTANPLLLWNLIASGHLDGLAAAIGFLGVALCRSPRAGGAPGSLRIVAAGLLVGIAADMKISFALFGLGLIWASRRSLSTMLSATVSALAVLAPTYLWFGPPALAALIDRTDNASTDTFYRLFSWPPGHGKPQLLVVVPVLAVVAVLMLRRLPDGPLTRPALPSLPAVQPALAVSLAWLFLWPYQLPWYDAMSVCLLAIYPASRLDWLVIGRLGATTIAMMPGNWRWPPPAWLSNTAHVILVRVLPVILLAAAVTLVWLCLTRAWRVDPPVADRQADDATLV